MAYIIIDRRKNTKGKSSVNRRRFVRRVKAQVKEAIKEVIKEGNIGDIVDTKGKRIKIPSKGLDEPVFRHDQGGIVDSVHTGNKKYIQGDRFDRPSGGRGGEPEASPDGEGEDEFTFHLTSDEFLDLFMEDLELPDLVKKNVTKIEEYIFKRAGFSVDGPPSRLNIVRTFKESKGRRFALRTPKKRKLAELEQQLSIILAEIETAEQHNNLNLLERLREQEQQLIEEIKELKRKITVVPFIDDMDLRYNRWEKAPVPSTQAVMFAIMDVSGSMGEWEKEMAKRFFMLLYLFLRRSYQKVEIVFIRHHVTAKEVDEQEFFYSKETGGTIVSSALTLMKEIIDQRYSPSQWNIFGAQASDGDNWPTDNAHVHDIMTNILLPISQYFAYVEINKSSRVKDPHGLWRTYEEIGSKHDSFQLRRIGDVTDIYPVFRSLFEKRHRSHVTNS